MSPSGWLGAPSSAVAPGTVLYVPPETLVGRHVVPASLPLGWSLSVFGFRARPGVEGHQPEVCGVDAVGPFWPAVMHLGRFGDVERPRAMSAEAVEVALAVVREDDRFVSVSGCFAPGHIQQSPSDDDSSQVRRAATQGRSP